MASKKTLNAQNLTALGAERLAALLIEISQGDAAARRRLRLELAGETGAAEVAREIRKRLTVIGRSRAYVEWDRAKGLIQDLEVQRRAIVDQVASADPVEALDLLWRFLDLAASIYERCDDSSGRVGAVFRGAVQDLGSVAAVAKPSTTQLAERSFVALCANDYGQYDGLIEALAPALGVEGLTLLREKVTDLSQAPTYKPARGRRVVIGYGMDGALYADQVIAGARDSMVQLALTDIADALGDVDAFIAQYDDQARSSPAIAAGIAERLLSAARAREALEAVQWAQDRGHVRRPGVPERPGRLNDALEAARIKALDALGRADEAQAARWAWFEQNLSAQALRDHLKRLPDFEDVEAEEAAMVTAAAHDDPHQALAFLTGWPALAPAARLVLERSGEIDGDRYEILTPAADALSARHPLAATLLLRSMIDFTLENARSSRYRHAARHLHECHSLAMSIEEFRAAETHEAYMDRLRRTHGRKSGFWSLAD
jgi:hypothetical protein